MLFPPLPQKTSQTFWLNTSKKFTPSTDTLIHAKGEIEVPSFKLEIGMYRITKIVYSGNWEDSLYRQNTVFDRTLFSIPGKNQLNILSKATRRQLLSYPLGTEMYFDLDWIDYFEVTQSGDTLLFSIDQVLTYDENEIGYGFFRPILGIQIQKFNDSRWEEAIRLGKI